MRLLRAVGWMLLGAMLAVALVSVGAEEDPLTDDEVVVRTEGAHRLLLPKDWPVQQRDGRFSPVPIEEYLSMKFGQVATKFDQFERRLSELEHQLQRLEEEGKTLQMRTLLLESSQQEGR